MTETSAETPKPAVQAAQSPGDVVRAMLRDPDLRKTVLDGVGAVALANKSLLGSKSFWVNILTPLATWVVTHYIAGLDANTVAVLVGIASAGMATFMRYITKEPVTSVLPQGTQT